MNRVDEGAGSPFRQPSSKARSTGNKRHPGRLFFGYFLLAKQKKVSRLPVREPALKQRRDSDTQNVGLRLKANPTYELATKQSEKLVEIGT
jgi:hypothetical protein